MWDCSPSSGLFWVWALREWVIHPGGSRWPSDWWTTWQLIMSQARLRMSNGNYDDALALTNYWVHQKICSSFSIRCNRKTQMKFLANLIFSYWKPCCVFPRNPLHLELNKRYFILLSYSILWVSSPSPTQEVIEHGYQLYSIMDSMNMNLSKL